MTLSQGDRLGRYEVLGPIGAGGMGEVWRALDTDLDREVAVKILPESFASDENRLERFHREAKALAALSHPNLLDIYDVGATNGIHYAVTELLEGDTLRERITPSGLPWKKVTSIGSAVADGLAAAHGRGIIHRDIKPENLFITADGRVKILDFGLASVHEEAEPDAETATITEAGTVMGTPGYMAPEQLTGDRSVINATTDVYGLGGILCVLLTGKPPRIEASAVADWYQTPRLEDRKAMAEVPPELCRIAERALSPAQADRFQSVDELKYEMEAFMAGGGWFATRRYLAGDVIIREGDSGAEAFIISSGVCDVFRGKLEGPRQFIRSMGPGDTFGELSVLTRKPRSASVVAQTDVSLRLVTVDALDRELKRNPVLASFMSAVTSRFCDLEARLDASQE